MPSISLLPIFTESNAPFLRRTRLDVTNAQARAGQFGQPPCPAIPELMALYLRRYGEAGFIAG